MEKTANGAEFSQPALNRMEVLDPLAAGVA